MKLTLKKIREKSPCESGWRVLLKSLDRKQRADDNEILVKHLLSSNGVDDTVWAIINCIEGETDKKNNMFADFVESAVNHAEEALPIFEKETDNKNPRLAIEEAKRCIDHLRNRSSIIIGEAEAAALKAWEAAHKVRGDARAGAWTAGWAARTAARAIIWHSLPEKICYRGEIEPATEAAAEAALSVNGSRSDMELEREKQKKIILKYFGD